MCQFLSQPVFLLTIVRRNSVVAGVKQGVRLNKIQSLSDPDETFRCFTITFPDVIPDAASRYQLFDGCEDAVLVRVEPEALFANAREPFPFVGFSIPANDIGLSHPLQEETYRITGCKPVEIGRIDPSALKTLNRRLENVVKLIPDCCERRAVPCHVQTQPTVLRRQERIGRPVLSVCLCPKLTLIL